MSKLIAILNEFGAEIFPKNTFRLPFKLKSSNFPVGIKYVAGSSAQLKSAAILAALNSYGTTTIFEKILRSKAFFSITGFTVSES